MDKEISKLNRKELLEILLEQAKISEQMESELEEVKSKLQQSSATIKKLEKEKIELKEELSFVMGHLEEAIEELDDRNIAIQESGSIAEAALKINGLFETAQKTVDDYIANAEKYAAQTDSMCQEKIDETTKACDLKLKETENECKRMLQDAEKDADAYWEMVSDKMTDFYNKHVGMKDLLASYGISVPEDIEIEE